MDLRLLIRNWRIALSVGAAGMVLPFGLGCAIAYGLYHQFRDDKGLVPISLGTYLLFIGVAMAITVGLCHADNVQRLIACRHSRYFAGF